MNTAAAIQPQLEYSQEVAQFLARQQPAKPAFKFVQS